MNRGKERDDPPSYCVPGIYSLSNSESVGRISIHDSLHPLRLMQLMIENAAEYRSQYGATHQEP